MIMCTLLSMVYGLCKPCRLTHVTKDITSLMLHVATFFKETALLLNVQLSFFVDFILCPTDKYMSKVNNKKIRLICWMCSKLKINTAWHSSVFVADFDHSQHVNIVFLLLTLNKCLLAGCKRQVIMFWEHEKRYICFVLKVVSPFSFNNLSLHQTGKSYEQMTNVSALNLLLEPQAYYHCFVPLFNLLYLKKKHFVL